MQCAALYAAFLDDAVRLQPPGVSLELWVPERPGALERLGARYPAARVRLQPEGSLGDRLEMAFARAFSGAADRVVAVGSDHPTLPDGLVERAFEVLETGPLVLGPSSDGGYYAIGAHRSAWPTAQALFADAPWSTPGLLAWTRDCIGSLGLGCTELPEWYDVDRPEDLPRMVRDLKEGSTTARTWARLALGPATRAGEP